ncbi:hypothetical protein D0B54_15925 [Solimonas sp. K1W22B-7]|uniref:hypothetical protein n=1 Tax=Solimonas sp. K1W22B-7 TaxID=2303331 RepID=UPI000E32DA03|nr:hypothetical protein [Solimonas sp. K1W22B-7]AXQ30067.1 hypothetical protein D0B54_15925 [Solimonas sp. K1W22B-7]
MRLLAPLLLLLLAQVVAAQPPASTTPVKWNGKLVTVGDTEGKVLAALGLPSQRVEVEDPTDHAVSDRWTFTDPTAMERPLIVKLRGGRVAEVRKASLPQ